MVQAEIQSQDEYDTLWGWWCRWQQRKGDFSELSH